MTVRIVFGPEVGWIAVLVAAILAWGLRGPR
jgi:hypothetical protein